MKPIVYKQKPRLAKNTVQIDAYSSAVKELFFINNPSLKKDSPETKKKLEAFVTKGLVNDSWIYYPDELSLVHTVNEKDYFILRTSRNRNLISKKQQKKFRDLSVGIAGLSVGSCILSALVVSGGPKKIKIADFDTLEVTNLNRIRGGLLDIGKNKIEIAAKEVWKLDPFAKLGLFESGITKANLKQFLFGKPTLNIFVDEMDSLDLKIQARKLCKQHKIPVIMATDNGDSVVLDIERFDMEPKRPIFHGLIGKVNNQSIKTFNYKQWLSLATKIVGPEYLTSDMQDSILQIGKTIPAVPQLGTTANVAGAAICLVIRRIANKQKMPSGRYVISLEEKLFPRFNDPKQIKLRKQQTQKFKQKFAI